MSVILLLHPPVLPEVNQSAKVQTFCGGANERASAARNLARDRDVELELPNSYRSVEVARNLFSRSSLIYL